MVNASRGSDHPILFLVATVKRAAGPKAGLPYRLGDERTPMRRMLSKAKRMGSIGAVLAAGGLAVAALPAQAAASPDSFGRTYLIASNASYKAKLTDPHLTNAWGLAAAPGEPIWVSDNNSGLAGVYSGGVKGSKVTLDLTVPVPGGNPTGQVFNPDASAFPVGGAQGGAAVFIVDTDSTGSTQSPGRIEAWSGGAAFTVEDSVTGGAGAGGGKTPAHAVFKGLAIATTPKAGPELFAADVANGKIDVFDKNFHYVAAPGEFKDPKIPAGYVPFNVQNLGGKLYVTYARSNHAKTDVLGGKGLAFVDVYSVDGKLVKHLVSGGELDGPWGLAIAPKGFGPFGGALLVGNLGNGWVNAYNPATGKYLGWLDTPSGTPVAIPGLWALEAGNSAFGGPSAVVFSAGPREYRDGLVGILTPAKPAAGGGW
jgi:uncharacterized protein (TIGR03118 family)